MRHAIVWLFIWGSSYTFGQLTDFGKDWVSLGPNEKPVNPKKSDDAGIGPIEFVRVYSGKEGHLLAGSLSGGLFYSNNGGESWSSTGSDNWDYTGCAWADFHPDNEKVWFACSNFTGYNGKPGRIAENGGLLRTKNEGKTWQLIAGIRNFGQSTELIIYGTRFHPENSDFIFVFTSEGIYYSENCMADFVKWNRIPNVSGCVYDLDFMDNAMYLTNFVNEKWHIVKFDQHNYNTFTKITDLENDGRPMRNLTIEPKQGELLIAKDFTKEKDEMCLYDPSTDSTWVILKNQSISFGSGHTLAVSPHQPNEFYFGNGTRVKKWAYPYDKALTVGSGYHVDVEFIAYDPFDSLKIYFATHGGVFISKNGNADWENMSDGLGVAEVMGLAVSKLDPSQIAIGTYHDGSMVLADFDQNGNYYWRQVNGGDGLIPLINPENNAIVYTSNQFEGGGLYYSDDTVKQVKRNLHSLNGLKTSGWELATVLDQADPNTVYFNFVEREGVNKGNINVCRTSNALERKSVEVVSDFFQTHKMKKYKVYGLFNSAAHPNVLIAYVLDYVKNEKGEQITNHRLFRTDKLSGTPEEVTASWYEIGHPNNTWIGDVEMDGYNPFRIFVSYTKGKDNPESMFGDRGMVYALKYRNDETHALKRQMDISKNIPNDVAGRYNMAYSKINGGSLFIATRTGVYYANSRVMRGKSRWVRIGGELPHCQVYGLDFKEDNGVLTVGYFGRGVWQYRFQ